MGRYNSQKKNNSPSIKDFENGNFQSIGLAECFEKLTDISNSEKEMFTKLASHRNKIIHFYHPTIEADKLQIAQEEFNCWFILKNILGPSYQKDIEKIDRQNRVYTLYLQIKYDENKDLIATLKNDDVDFIECPVCGHESFQCDWAEENEIEHECLVCGLHANANDKFCGHCVECDSLESIIRIGCKREM